MSLDGYPPGRRIVLRSLPALALAMYTWPVGNATARQLPQPLRVGVTPAFLQYQNRLLRQWEGYTAARMGLPVQFVRRERYREAMDMLRLGALDFAWICSYPYLQLREHVRLLATPLHQGLPLYHSYVIAGASNRHAQSIGDLRGAIFAYADPNSNSGYLVPRYMLKQIGETPASFFSRTFFTYSHRKVIEAVALGVADAGAVDSHVYETLKLQRSDLTDGTRIVVRSDPYGFSPFVAHRAIREPEFDRVQRGLLEMHENPAGAEILRELNLDRFVRPEPRLYEGVLAIMRSLGEA